MFNQPHSQLYDHLDLALLGRLFLECCREVLTSTSLSAAERDAMRLRIGKSLTRSIVSGERDSKELKQIALRAVFLPARAEADWPSCSWYAPGKH